MIISGAFAQQIIPEIENMPQLESIYIFCGNRSYHRKWTKQIQKVKGVYTKFEYICEALQIDRENCDRKMIAINFKGLDPLFIYTQLVKETLLEIEDDDAKSINDLVHYCRLQDDIPDNEINKIEREYRDHSPIWWYTAPYFINSILNRGLRVMDPDIISKMGFFIRHLHTDINKLYREQQQQSNKDSPFRVYRGQGLSLGNFEKMKQNNAGGFMSFNNFLSTSLTRNTSLKQLPRPTALRTESNTVGILFVLTIDPVLCDKSNIPYADVTTRSYFQDREAEILFTTHTIFRIDSIEGIPDRLTDRVWEVHLTIVGNNNEQINEQTSHLREEIVGKKGWPRLGDIFIRLGEPSKAEQLYKALLDTSTNPTEKAGYYNLLGRIYDDIGEYSKALSAHQQSLEIYKIALRPNHPSLANTYNNIGLVYRHAGEYTKALSSYEQSLEIYRIVLPPNHPSLATSYNNIGSVYDNMGGYSKALSSFQQSLEIQKKALPPNHPSLATTHNSIGLVYRHTGEYTKALSSYEQSLEIYRIVLPPNHPDFAQSYNNIGSVYDNMGEYSKALSSYQKSLEIYKTAVRPNQTSLATTHNSIGSVYLHTGEYLKSTIILQALT